MICLYTNWKVYVACNFSCRVKPEGLLKVTGSHVHCKSGNISETVQDRDVVLQIWGEFQGHSHTAILFKWDFSYSWIEDWGGPSCCRGTARRALVRVWTHRGKYVLHFPWYGIQKGLKPDLQGHSRSLALVPFDRPRMISYLFSTVDTSILYHFRSITSCFPKFLRYILPCGFLTTGKISTDSARRAVPLQQLRLLSSLSLLF